MNIFGIEINAQNVSLAFTIVFLAFVVFNGLVGFIRSTKKSIYYLIVSAIVFGLGFGLMSIAISALFSIPIGQYVGSMVQSFYPEVQPTSTAEDIILGALKTALPQFSNAVDQGNVTASLIIGLVSFVVKLVYIIALLVLAFTLFKLIADIIWLIIRPKKKNGKRPPKTFGGRMGGFGIGAAKGAVYALLVFALIAGIASVATSALAVSQTASNEETEAVLVLTDKHATLITLDAEEGNNSSSQNSLFGDMDMEFLLSVVGAYRQSVPGYLYEAVQISTVPIDEYLFDGVFSFDVQMGEEVINVKLRKEIQTVADAIANVANEFDLQEISLEALLNIDSSGEEALKGLIDAVSDLSILKVAIPVALEVAVYSDALVDENGNNLFGELFTPDQIPDLSNALISDVKSIGYSLVDARALLTAFVGDEEKDINTYLNLDANLVKMLFDDEHLGGLGAIDILAPIAVTYLTTGEGLRSAIEEFGLSIEDITKLPEGDTWGKEIAKLGDVYIAIQDLLKDPETGTVNLDTEDFTKVLDLFTEEKIDNFVDTLFSSNIISNSIGALVTFATNSLLPDDFKQYIQIGNDVTFDATECKAFLNAATCLVQSGLLSGDLDLATMLDTMDVDKFAKYLAQSQIIRSSLAGSLDLLLSSLSSGGTGLRFGTFEDWDDQESTEIELRSVLRSIKLLAKNLFNEEGENQGLSLNALSGLTEKELELILSSKIMSGTLVNFLVDNCGEGQTLSMIGNGIAYVNANPDGWYDQYKLVEECYFSGSSLQISSRNVDMDEIYNVSRYLVYCNGIYLTSVRTNAGEGRVVDLSQVVTGKDESGNPIYHVPSGANEYTAYGVNVKRMGYEQFDITGSTLHITPSFTSLDDFNQVNKFNVYADDELLYSVRVNASGPVDVDLSTIVVGKDDQDNDIYFQRTDDTKFEVYGYNEGELRKIFMAVLSITSKLGDSELDFSNSDALTSAISKVDDNDIENITASIVINEALISAIEDLANQDGAFIYIPSELKDTTGKIDREEWRSQNESANILKAIKTIFNGGSIDSSNLKIAPIIEQKDEILKSLVICETIKHNLVNISGIDIPEGEDLSADSLDGWKNEYYDGEVVVHGELSLLLSAIENIIAMDETTTINSISTDSLNLKKIIEESDETILRSKVLSETIRVKLCSPDTSISIPKDQGLSETDLTGWKNTYTSSGILETRGEISHILHAIDIIIDIDETTKIDSIPVDSIQLQTLIDHADEVIESLVISETIRVKLLDVQGIDIPHNDPKLSDDSLDGWINETDQYGIVKHGELSHLLKAIGIILPEDTNTINDISTDAISLKNIIDDEHIDVVLRSRIISETIRVKLTNTDQTGISIPKDQGLSEDNLEGWENIYNDDDTVALHQEIYSILKSLEYILDLESNPNQSIGSLNISALNLNSIIEHSDDILKSIVITNAIKDRLLSVNGIDIPKHEGLDDGSLDKWKNTYKVNGDVDTRGEISHILTAIKYVCGETASLQELSTESIKLKSVIDNRDEILLSLILSETIRKKIVSNSIDIPTGEDVEKLYKEDIDGDSISPLTGWKNYYDENDELVHGELSRLLEAIGVMFNPSEDKSITNVDVNDINIKHIIEKSDQLLRSLVISETLRIKICGMSGIEVPADDDKLSPDYLSIGWQNVYSEEDDEVVVKRGELHYMLHAIDIALNPGESTKINTLDTNIKLGNIINNSDAILHSKVLSETIKVKIISAADSGGTLKLPANYNVKSYSNANYIIWENVYEDESDVPTERHELSALLDSVGDLMSDADNETFDSLSALDYTKLFEEETQKDLIKSKIISETIITHLESYSSVLVIPTETANTPYELTDELDRSDWWDEEKGELKYFLAAIDILLGEDAESRKNLNKFNVDITSAYKSLTNEDDRTVLLSSCVIAATLRHNFADHDQLKENIPNEEEAGIDLSDADQWYTIDANRNPSNDKELWKLLSSIHMLLGNSFNAETNISIQQLFENDNFVPDLDEEKNNSIVKYNYLHNFLQSKVMEKVFVGIVKGILVEGFMNSFMVTPTPGGYQWYEYQYLRDHDGDPDYEYDLLHMIESLYQMEKANLGYKTFESPSLSKLNDIETDKLADAFVISRAFRGSIEKALNGLFGPFYIAKYGLVAWNSVKLVQSDYDGLSKKEASELLATNLSTIINDIKS